MTLHISFEVFPPKTPEGLVQLGDTVEQLRRIDPIYVSVTYGAGGSERTRSFDAIRTTFDTGVPVAAHLTCVGQSIAELRSVLDEYVALGVQQVVALRGDPPTGIDAPYEPHPEGFQRTSDLVAATKARGGLEVSVSAYPEKHPQSPTEEHDLDVLAEKVAAGADRAMTQMFFDNDLFARFLDRVRARGIEIPIVPGIFPIHSFEAVARFAARCGASMPAALAARFDGLAEDEIIPVAADVAAQQIRDLQRLGIDHVHIYTINRPELALAVCDRLELEGATR